MSTVLEAFETLQPSVEDSRVAEETSRRLAPFLSAPQARFQMQISPPGNPAESLEIPSSAIPVLFHILTQMAQGNALTLIPTHAELPAQDAADFLNVSRSYLNMLLDENKIPSRKVGHDRRIVFRDLLDYKRRSDAERREALEEVSKLGQEIDEGF